MGSPTEVPATWPHAVYERLRKVAVRHVGYVPDAGHAALIDLAIGDPAVTCTMLTTEEEGVALAVGAWLGGLRSVVLMQSSGVGNCINMLSLPVQTRTPLLLLVTMRGEWAEFNPWQVPMGQATEASLTAIGVQAVRVDDEEDIADTVSQAAAMAYEADQQVAVLLGQKLLGEKTW
jgi:sulfopyruvate decarboxylase alpha subunit